MIQKYHAEVVRIGYICLWLGLFWVQIMNSTTHMILLLPKRSSYLRSEKLLTIESHLKKTQMNTSVLKFNGRFKLIPNKVGVSEINTEELFLHVGKYVYSYGLQSFFYMAHENNIEYIFENSRLFTVEEGINNHNTWVKELASLITIYSKDKINESILAQVWAHNTFENSFICPITSLPHLLMLALCQPSGSITFTWNNTRIFLDQYS